MKILASPNSSAVNRSSQSTRCLVAWWNPGLGGRTARTLRDLSGNHWDASFIGTAAWSARRPHGGFQSIHCDGSSHVETTLTGDFPAAQGTLLIWFRPNNAHNSGVREFIIGSFNQPGPVSFEFGIQHFTNNNLFVGWKNGATDTRVTVAASTSNWIQNKWQQYAITWVSGGTTTLYHNARSIGTRTGTSTFTPSVHLDIGNTTDQAFEFTGDIGDTQIHDFCMSASQVHEAYMEAHRNYPTMVNRIQNLPDVPAVAAPPALVPEHLVARFPRRTMVASFRGKTDIAKFPKKTNVATFR